MDLTRYYKRLSFQQQIEFDNFLEEITEQLTKYIGEIKSEKLFINIEADLIMIIEKYKHVLPNNFDYKELKQYIEII